MHLATMIEMIEGAFADRALLGSDEQGWLTGADLGRSAGAGAATLADRHTAVVYVGENHPLLPVALFAAARAGISFVPINYRLEDDQIRALIDRQPGAIVLVDRSTHDRLAGPDAPMEVFDDWLARLPDDPSELPVPFDDEAVAVTLFTSGTTSEPKAALLRHRHLMAYLLGTVEFGAAAPDDAALVSVPPYHVAGVANLLSNLYSGRRLVYLRSFDAAEWLRTARREAVTNAMVVPTMLARIVGELDGAPADVPTLRTLSYGGAKMSERVLRAALEAFPDTGFVNAYGLTETASTVAVLGPEDHRAALTSTDLDVRARLASVGRALPTIEVEIRDESGTPLPAGEVGMIFLRGEQIAGEYSTGSLLDDAGWFRTRDRGHVDEDGYLFIEGREDDTIIRGGENIAPAEIEDVLLGHDDVLEACVVGVPDDEWGQRIVAVVVGAPGVEPDSEALRELVRARLRGSKTPDAVVFRDELPHTDTGKLLRRVVVAELTAES